jgi:hypothetical protein
MFGAKVIITLENTKKIMFNFVFEHGLRGFNGYDVTLRFLLFHTENTEITERRIIRE